MLRRFLEPFLELSEGFVRYQMLDVEILMRLFVRLTNIYRRRERVALIQLSIELTGHIDIRTHMCL